MIEKILARLEDYKYSHLVEHDSERIEHCKEQEGHCEGSDCFLCIWDRAIEIVQEEANDGGWIPCSERLPEDFTEVLIFTTSGSYDVACVGYSYSDIGGVWKALSGYWKYDSVIAWMPLPAPYQKGE